MKVWKFSIYLVSSQYSHSFEWPNQVGLLSILLYDRQKLIIGEHPSSVDHKLNWNQFDHDYTLSLPIHIMNTLSTSNPLWVEPHIYGTPRDGWFYLWFIIYAQLIGLFQALPVTIHSSKLSCSLLYDKFAFPVTTNVQSQVGRSSFIWNSHSWYCRSHTLVQHSWSMLLNFFFRGCVFAKSNTNETAFCFAITSWG